MNAFTCNVDEVKYTETRRGVNALVTIYKDGKPFAVLDDKAEAIVANMTFHEGCDIHEFLDDARANGHNQPQVTHAMSEHARAILYRAEDEFKAKHGNK